MKSTAAEFGTKLVLMSYASVAGKYRTANQTLRRVAIRNDTAFIDNAQLFEERCGGENCPELFFPDGHPSAEGHRLMAERIAEWLAASRASR